jgi:hypothetical protein
MSSFLKYVDLYLTSEWGRFYVGNAGLMLPLENISGASRGTGTTVWELLPWLYPNQCTPNVH